MRDAFDFWLGSWRGSWADGSGTNEVSKAFDGHVVLEQFAAEGFSGLSLSVFDESRAVWRQTWVDSEGNYLDFEGAFADGEMRLERDAGDARQRMVWTDIADDTFEWYWQRREPGEDWRTLWHISYERQSAQAPRSTTSWATTS